MHGGYNRGWSEIDLGLIKHFSNTADYTITSIYTIAYTDNIDTDTSQLLVATRKTLFKLHYFAAEVQ